MTALVSLEWWSWADGVLAGVGLTLIGASRWLLRRSREIADARAEVYEKLDEVTDLLARAQEER
jgi:hypothetical protein